MQFHRQGVISMLTTHKTLQPTVQSQTIWRHLETNMPIVFFDIETTGFHRDYSKLVSISFLELNDDMVRYHYYFNETGKEEQELLSAISPLLSSKYLVSFNGDGFDVPYLMHKYNQHKMTSPLTAAHNLDLMKVAKESLQLKRYKLKNIETELGILRTDTFSGLDCVEAYKLYLDTGDTALADKIALHNEEDTLNLMELLYRLLEQHSGIVEHYKPHYFEWRNLELALISLQLQGDFAILTFEPDQNMDEIHWYDDHGHILKTRKDGNLTRLDITLPVEHHSVDGFELSLGRHLKGNPGARVISVDGRPLYVNLHSVLNQLQRIMNV
jgi:uncharacterized protein YprB with RNaseH-like and TPR domain